MELGLIKQGGPANRDNTAEIIMFPGGKKWTCTGFVPVF